MGQHRCRCNWLIAMGWIVAAAGIAMGDEVPRYQLRVGEQLVFHCERTETKTGADAYSAERSTDWKIDVVGQNADGSWRLVNVVDSGGNFHQGKINVKYERIVEASDCDLYPDGKLRGDDDPMVNLSELFPQLPADAKQPGSGWEDQTFDHSRRLRFHPGEVHLQGQNFSFTSTVIGGIQGVFEPGLQQTYQFDPRVGAVDRIQFTAGGANSSYSEKGEIRRTTIHQLDAAVIQKLAQLGSEFDQADGMYRKAVASGRKDELKPTWTKLNQTANALIQGAFTDAGSSPASLKETLNAMAPDSELRGEVLNAAAPVWTAHDIDGNARSSRDFQGKIVVMDFGSRYCPWCIREVPQLIRLAADFKDQPVTIIDMALDDDVADAKFVVDAMGVGYPSVLAGKIYNEFPLEGTPTVIIVDEAGIMRRRFVGYDTTGYDEMKAAIQSLLDAKKQ